MRQWTTKWMAGLLGVAGVIALAGPVRNASAANCGDLNGDNKLTIADAVRLQKAVFVNNPADCGGQGSTQCGDVSVPDPGIGPADVVALQNSLAGRPNLYPLCGGQGPSICIANAGSGPGGESWTKRATVTGNITTSQIWEAGCRIDVDGLTFVQPGVTVTIQPGALVVGKNPPSQNGGPTSISALIFLRGSKINASGTAANPIVMTSSSHVDANNGQVKSPEGDWGGLTLNGAGPVNCPGGECLAEGLVGVPFGGTNPNDSSGVLEFVRIEFSGKELSPDNELNVLTMNGIGSGTIIDHVQANNGFDDCLEWFGGNVNAKFLVSAGCGDDMFDTQLGTVLNAQYALGVYYQPNLQNAGNNGFEWDNNENGFSLLPNNDPHFCNTTLIGTSLQPSVGLGASEFAMLLRRGTAGNIANTIAEHFRITGISLRDKETANHACSGPAALNNTAPILRVQHTLLFDNGFAGDGATPGTGEIAGSGLAGANCDQNQFYSLMVTQGLDPANPNNAGLEHNPNIPVIYGTGVANAQTDLNQFIPAGGSPGVATQPLVNTLAMDCKTINSFFDTTNYLGAFRPGDPASNWLSTPWINFRLH